MADDSPVEFFLQGRDRSFPDVEQKKHAEQERHRHSCATDIGENRFAAPPADVQCYEADAVEQGQYVEFVFEVHSVLINHRNSHRNQLPLILHLYIQGIFSRWL